MVGKSWAFLAPSEGGRGSATFTERAGKRAATFAGKMRRLVFAFFLAALFSSTVQSAPKPKPADEENKPLPTIAQKTAGCRRCRAFQDLLGCARRESLAGDREVRLRVPLCRLARGRRRLERHRARSRAIRRSRRDARSPEHLVRFERVGPKVLLVEKNLGYRAVTKNADEQRCGRGGICALGALGFQGRGGGEGSSPGGCDGLSPDRRAWRG